MGGERKVRIEEPRTLTSGKVSSHVTIPLPTDMREPVQLDLTLQTAMASTTWLGMYGNGCRTGIGRTRMHFGEVKA
jgi:hypothetical protein